MVSLSYRQRNLHTYSHVLTKVAAKSDLGCRGRALIVCFQRTLRHGQERAQGIAARPEAFWREAFLAKSLQPQSGYMGIA